jgi:hypothetical protein
MGHNFPFQAKAAILRKPSVKVIGSNPVEAARSLAPMNDGSAP